MSERCRIICADVLAGLSQLEDCSVHTCVTSPPYYALRDYGVEGQIGLEKTPDEYIARMVEVFREVRRVLRDDGTLWLNIADSYARSGRAKGSGPTGPLSAKQITNAGAYFESPLNGLVPDGCKPKDLIGIPWMLAFALRQPWERHVIQSVANRAWMAGLFDGEGCVSVIAVQPTTGINESHSMRLQVRMADVEAVERIVEITGMSNVTYDQATGEGCRPAQQWKISGDKAADVIADIFPYLTVKRKQAIVGWNIQRLKDGVVTKRGVPIPSENMAKRRLLFDVIRKLNQRQTVDIPSWCELPTTETEPGWYLRCDCIWSKPNPMPESVTDRPTKAHEYMFLLAKSDRYYYDADAISEPVEKSSIARWSQQIDFQEGSHRANGGAKTNGTMKAVGGPRKTDKQSEVGKRTYKGFNARWAASVKAEMRANGTGLYAPNRADTGGVGKPSLTRNKRSVWEIATQPYPEAHFATFPTALVKPCVLAGSPEGGTVLDPFCGSGTTGVVALQYGRNFVGIELSAEYCKMAEKRIAPVLAQEILPL